MVYVFVSFVDHDDDPLKIKALMCKIFLDTISESGLFSLAECSVSGNVALCLNETPWRPKRSDG